MVILLSLSSLHLCVDFQGCKDLVAHTVIVQSQGIVTLDLNSLHLADVDDPLGEATLLQTQESKDGSISLILALDFLLLSDSFQVGEPSADDHKFLDLLRLLLLVAGRSV